MKRILTLAFAAAILLIACTKKNDNSPPGSVTINGKTYKTVVIAGQTWTAENYDGPGGVLNPRGDEAVIGKYYLLDEVMRVTLPRGWRVPTIQDFDNLLDSQGSVIRNLDDSNLLDSIGSRHLRSTTGWVLNGDDKSGFNAYGAGSYDAGLKAFSETNASAFFWSSTSWNDGAGLNQCFLAFSSYPSNKNYDYQAFTNPWSSALNAGYNLR